MTPPRTRDWGLRITLLVAALLGAGAFYVLAIASDDLVPTSGPSMGRTLADGPVAVDTRAFEQRLPAVGEIVVAQAPVGVRAERCGVPHPADEPCPQAARKYADFRVLKRIVGGPGDRIAFAPDGAVIRNGEAVREDYVRPCRPRYCALPSAITVPPDHWFLAGDNRGNSSDSRIWGPVPTAALDGLVETPE
ncbi:MAG: signal peptidase I [Solirubrobacteraceae bacterium]